MLQPFTHISAQNLSGNRSYRLLLPRSLVSNDLAIGLTRLCGSQLRICSVILHYNHFVSFLYLRIYQEDLGATFIVLLLDGRVSDAFGRKSALLFAATAFFLGSFFCGVANDLWSLVAARLVAGIGGGGLNTVNTKT